MDISAKDKAYNQKMQDVIKGFRIEFLKVQDILFKGYRI